MPEHEKHTPLVHRKIHANIYTQTGGQMLMLGGVSRSCDGAVQDGLPLHSTHILLPVTSIRVAGIKIVVTLAVADVMTSPLQAHRTHHDIGI